MSQSWEADSCLRIWKWLISQVNEEHIRNIRKISNFILWVIKEMFNETLQHDHLDYKGKGISIPKNVIPSWQYSRRIWLHCDDIFFSRTNICLCFVSPPMTQRSGDASERQRALCWSGAAVSRAEVLLFHPGFTNGEKQKLKMKTWSRQ